MEGDLRKANTKAQASGGCEWSAYTALTEKLRSFRVEEFRDPRFSYDSTVLRCDGARPGVDRGGCS